MKTISVLAAATMLACSPATVYEWLRAGRLTRHGNGKIEVSAVQVAKLARAGKPKRGRPFSGAQPETLKLAARVLPGERICDAARRLKVHPAWLWKAVRQAKQAEKSQFTELSE